MKLGRAAALAMVLGVTGSALGVDTYVFTVNQGGSSLTGTFSATAPFTGTFIGNYNATSNPTGTRTLTGAFGSCSGTNNQAIGISGSGGANGAPSTHPTGGFTVSLDTAAGRISLYRFSADLLGGTQPTVATTANATYQAFHSCSPTGFFPSLNIPLNLGDAIITRMTATQLCSPSVGTLTATPTPGVYTYSVDTVVTIDAGLIFNGAPQDTTPTDVPVTIAGTVTVTGGSATISATMTLTQHQEIAGPIPAATDAPFDIPNPLGGTVHVLMTLSLTSVTIDLSGNASISATGATGPVPCLSDWNNDHTVNSQDFFDFLTSFFAGTADFNCSGATNSQDFFDFLSAFFLGC